MKSTQRAFLLGSVAGSVVALDSSRRLLVAVDGVDGAGKSTFADELAEEVRALRRPVIRASADGFHRCAVERYRLGRSSPSGFYRDSYDYDRMRAELLNPCSSGGTGLFRDAVFDVDRDVSVEGRLRVAPSDAIVIIDGLFLHRREIRRYWDYSIFLDVDFEVSIPRGASRGSSYGSPNPAAPSNRRYVEGQRLYFHDAQPTLRASIVIDNNDLSHPTIASEL